MRRNAFLNAFGFEGILSNGNIPIAIEYLNGQFEKSSGTHTVPFKDRFEFIAGKKLSVLPFCKQKSGRKRAGPFSKRIS